MSLSFKLQTKLLWLRHAWTFNWAHKPLCDRFKAGVLKIGPVHVCRSCTCLYAGVMLGGIALLLTAPAGSTWLVAGFLAALLLVVAGSLPRIYRRLHRRLCDLLRFGAGALFPLAMYVGVVANPALGIAGLLGIYAFWRIYFAKRAVRKLHECDDCPELANSEICSGFREQASSVRAFEREATDLLYRKGHAWQPPGN